jgi:hypothetical protein
MASNKRGVPRKSRRARLPSASITGRQRFTPSTEQWRRIEHAFGVRFSDEDYRQLTIIIDRYFRMQPLETAAAFLDDAQAYLKAVLTNANALNRSLQPPASRSDAAFYVQRLILENFHTGQPIGPGGWNMIVMSMIAFVAASEQAEVTLSRRMKGGGFVEGYAWRKLIRELTHFCNERLMPTAASKGLIKGNGQSPFVAFVYELQRAFPENFRRHNFSPAALATAIADARRPPARETKSAEART